MYYLHGNYFYQNDFFISIFKATDHRGLFPLGLLWKAISFAKTETELENRDG